MSKSMLQKPTLCQVNNPEERSLERSADMGISRSEEFDLKGILAGGEGHY